MVGNVIEVGVLLTAGTINIHCLFRTVYIFSANLQQNKKIGLGDG